MTGQAIGLPDARPPGQMKIVDGQALYETPTSQGKMVVVESATEWVWQWQGQAKISDKSVTHERQKSK